MSNENEIIVVSKNVKLYESINQVIKDANQSLRASLVTDLSSLIGPLENRTVAFVLIDLDADSTNLMNEFELLTSRFFSTRFITLCENTSSNLVIKSMQLGIRHVQLKSSINTELVDVLLRLLPGALMSRTHGGRCYTILSAGGGCGSTTLAVNLAHELSDEGTRPILLVDMDYYYGSIASYLELNSDFGIADLLAQSGVIDINLVNTGSVPYSDMLSVLISPASIDFHNSKILDYSRLSDVLAVCKQAKDFTVIDAPRIPMQAARVMADSTDSNIVVFQGNVKDIRVAKSMITDLMESGVPAHRIRPVMNRHQKGKGFVGMDEAQEAIGGLPITDLSNDYTSTAKSINFGKPLFISSPRSSLRQEIIELARELRTDADSSEQSQFSALLKSSPEIESK
jgi:Flp pilus assembly CpaE family ATPase